MKAELITIGDEILIGQIVNTNAVFLSKALNKIGIEIVQITSVSDDKAHIVHALDASKQRAEIAIITGGLGPTKDDITKHTLCEFFNTSLEMHEPTLEKIKAFFALRNRPMLESNNLQAELPMSCQILENNYGTAAGMWFERDHTIYISLPGVPYEMKGIMSEEAIPKLQSLFELKSMYYKTAMTQGKGESFLAEIIKEWEEKVYSKGLSLAYLPSPGLVKLRITSTNGDNDADAIDELFTELEQLIPKYLFGYDSDTLPSVIGKLLTSKSLSIGTVESCTCGKLASYITEVSGASSYFMGSLLTYSNDLKQRLASVSEESLNQFGAVSEQVAKEMAEGGRLNLGVDVCISTTGIAGPTGGSDEKPVGMVWVAISTCDQTITHKFQFSQHRERNIHMTTLCALNMLKNMLSE